MTQSAKRKAFTLVELLVVIAIVGLISTVAAVSMNNSRDKAKIAAGQSFDQSMRHGLGDQLVGEWLMNECSGNTTGDISGNGNTATFGVASAWGTNAPGNAGCSASFTGTNYLGTTLNVQSPNVTFSAWVYPTSTTGYNEIISKEAQYKFRIHEGNLEALMSCAGVGWSYALYLTKPQVPINNWSMVALTIDSVNQTAALYLNGNMVGKTSTCTVTAYNGNAIGIGSSYSTLAHEPFHGNIDDARVYTSSLGLAQIKKIYAENLPTYLLAMQKSK